MNRAKGVHLLCVSHGFEITSRWMDGHVDIYIGSNRFSLVWVGANMRKMFEHQYSQARRRIMEMCRSRLNDS